MRRKVRKLNLKKYENYSKGRWKWDYHSGLYTEKLKPILYAYGLFSYVRFGENEEANKDLIKDVPMLLENLQEAYKEIDFLRKEVRRLTKENERN